MSLLASLLGTFGPLLLSILKWLGFNEQQSKDFLKRISDSQSEPVGPNTQDELDAAQKAIDEQIK